MAAATPKLKLFTNHMCPWAHRAHIALAELRVPFEEEIIDLSKPRTAEYLKINPRGLVPSLAVNDDIITESAIVTSYLADAFPSHLAPASTDLNGPLARARMSFFADTWTSKVNGHVFKITAAQTDAQKATAGKDIVDAVVKELEPLLANAAPFFNGSDKLTLAEALTGSFIVRLFTFPKYGLIPRSVLDELSIKAPNFYRWGEAVSKHPSVTGIFDEAVIAERTKQRFAATK
ncbi:Uu.00g054760.m01.CDS01 [Anthostomella pinea]|uniref:Uu.00g054760.m01.CDS01 n=1 Tax=Anthostomella pinea TaxID=933095 RepID=A0AAI8VQZ2_9PEZI|nr:Uu.00g054760.m01.CDS01 [Anthostomella pinea]